MVRAMYSGVAGLRAHQTRMDVIGNNIANVNTYGFKSSRTTFRDVYYQTLSGASAGSQLRGGVNATQVGYGAQVASIDLMMGQSGFQPTDRGTDVAIAGQGFIQVQDAEGNTFYTRAGMLTIDPYGNVVDNNGNFVLGVSGANAASAAPGSNRIRITVDPIQDAQAESVKSITLGGFTDDITVTCANPGTAGNRNIVFVTGPGPGATVAVTDTTLTVALVAGDTYSLADINTLLSTAPATTANGGFTLAAGGTLPTTAFTGTDMVAALGTIQTRGGQSYALQDVGNLTSLAIGSNGIISANHLGETLTLGRIDLAVFDNPEGLNAEGNTYFSASANSGAPSICVPGTSGSGPLKAGALEMSNVDLSQEFTDMITTQRGFQANSRIITVTDQMLEELVNLKR